MNDERREAVFQAAAAILEQEGSAGARLHRVCDYLRQHLPGYDWVGFYLAVRGEPMLILGPFSGEPTEHLRIPFGRGVCGRAAEEQHTVVVQDVSAETNYLSCSVEVKSEIVVPVFHERTDERTDDRTGDRTVVGELDVDSHSSRAFGHSDRALLERLAAACSALVAEIAPAR